jgi:hypothetical protein
MEFPSSSLARRLICALVATMFATSAIGVGAQ